MFDINSQDYRLDRTINDLRRSRNSVIPFHPKEDDLELLIREADYRVSKKVKAYTYKTPFPCVDWGYTETVIWCPGCEEEFEDWMLKKEVYYCPWCGQCLDWNPEEDEEED